jgi:hypothetical protein
MRQIQSIETSVSSGIRRFVRVVLILNSKELSSSSIVLKSFKPPYRQPGSPRAEKKEFSELILIVGLQTVPEPLDNLMCIMIVSSVLGILLPILQINLGIATEELIKLLIVELLHLVLRQQSIEPSLESCYLSTHYVLGYVLYLDDCVLHLIVICYPDLSPILREFMVTPIRFIIHKVLFQ